MVSYNFTYSDAAGGVIRWTVMQCASDAEAVAMARDTMRDPYSVLEIFAGERAVDSPAAVAA